MFKKERILGFEIVNANVEEIVQFALVTKNITVINTINPHSYIVSKSDSFFRQSLIDSDFLIPDGSGICLASKLINGRKLKKIAGYDVFFNAMKQLNMSDGKVYFLGSSELVLEKIKCNMYNDFPNILIKTLSPPFKSTFSVNEINDFVEDINKFSPDAVFVGLTAPKQEKLIHEIKKRINTKLISGVGAVFDFYAGTITRPSQLWIDLHLEWLIRFLGEPKRLWRRNFISTPLFLIDVTKEKI
ncbi:WecB/TagA/CpsF family glycosyltransferase, partial [Escherichia coli]|nr:WecB/TagA/CpsF family glycosyltransferase [Escherichia coli]EFK3473534.1 WecB/TagA/CpsF family glycosyltransferase [Escherichia coli]EIG5997290.1 WecB/TagA/CpsF family glycosyltransferase [Escherichia coli]HBD2112161.1 WecB/TagA/CpsF family glycosyltransferase [Escherichia coli]HBE5361746.1 WecB/TagA/CpsF family glycosyltransferase [Escherichia coli]